MGLFTKYLNQKDKEEMAKWKKLIDDQSTILGSLQESFNLWFYKKIAEYKLDPTKNWTLNSESGQITEIKKEEIKEEKPK